MSERGSTTGERQPPLSNGSRALRVALLAKVFGSQSSAVTLACCSVPILLLCGPGAWAQTLPVPASEVVSADQLEAAASEVAANDQSGVVSNPSPTSIAPPTVADAKQLLLEQAAYWRSQAQPARAVSTLQRLLAFGENADALALLAHAQIEAGQTMDARKSIDRLRKLDAKDARIAEIEHDLQVGQPDGAKLEEARGFAQQGRITQAVKSYKQAFHDAPPPSRYASEYYLTLGGTPAGFETARKDLGQIVVSNPRDLRAQVAYAKLLSYDEGTREEAIKRLSLLAKSPTVQKEADEALRQTLQWLPDTSDSLDAVASYVKRHPGDEQLTKKLDLIRNPPMSPNEIAGKARMDGFDKMDKSLLDEAEQDFKKALSINPDDPDATAGLGFLRIRQGHVDEGRELLKHAKELGPTDEEGIDATLKSTDPAGAVKVDEAALRETQEKYRRVATLTKQGRYKDAETLLRQLGGADPNLGFYLQLGGIQALAGRAKEAEASYRSALDLKPDNAAATIALAGALLRQHRDREAEILYAKVGDTKAAGQIRAERLRSQARNVSDPVAQAGLYRQAVQADPTNPWLRLELARALLRQNRGSEARAVMAVVYGRGAEVQGLEAAFYFAVEIDDLQLAATLVSRLPPAKRTAQMIAVEQRVVVRGEIAQAVQDAPQGTARTRLLALAAIPDPTGARVEEIARYFVSLNDRRAAADAVTTQLATDPSPSLLQRIAYANALSGAERPLEGERLLEGTSADGLSRSEQRALNAARDGLTVAVSDRLRFDSHYREAGERLQRRLEVAPQDIGLNLALARLYISQAQLGRAVALTQDLLRQHPQNLDVEKGAVDALIAVNDLDRADVLAQEAIEGMPNDPRAYMLAAQVARRRDDDGRVVQYLRLAKELRRGQSPHAGDASDAAAPAGATPAGFDGSSRVGTGNLDDNTFRPGPLAEGVTGEVPNVFAGTGLSDTQLAGQRIDAEIATLRDEVSPQGRAGIGVLARTGQEGLGRLTVITTPLETTFSPGGEGILRAQVTPTIVNGSAPNSASGGLQSFGTNPLQTALGEPLTIAGDQKGAGVGLDVRYTYRFASLDIGSTPLGFLRANVVGGVELAPNITPELQLRVTADRRAVINSVLSYNGARDPVTGTVWGAVVRNRGFAQLEWSPGRLFVFGGAGGGVVTGNHVQDNAFEEAILGASYGIYENGPQELRVGVNVPFFNYAHNQNAFSLGNGGYFSPQNYISVLPIISWRDHWDRLSYRVSASAGYQNFSQRAPEIFPVDPGLQAAFGRAAGISTLTPGTTSSGLAYGAEGEFEYKIDAALRFGGRAAFQKAGDYTEGSALLYGRYIFDTVRR